MSPTAEQLESALRHRLETRGDCSLVEFERELGISHAVVRRTFGSWGRLRERLGLPRRKPAAKFGPTNAEIVAALHRLAANDPDLKLCHFLAATGWSHELVRQRFASWPALRRAAGLPARTTDPRRRISDTELLDDLHRIWTDLHVLPNTTDIALHGTYSPSTYTRRLGLVDQLTASLARHAAEKAWDAKADPTHPHRAAWIENTVARLLG